MSKIGKINISIPEKVKVALAGNILNIEGPLGKSSLDIDLEIFNLDIKDGKEISLKPKKIDQNTTCIEFLNSMKKFILKDQTQFRNPYRLDKTSISVDNAGWFTHEPGMISFFCYKSTGGYGSGGGCPIANAAFRVIVYFDPKGVNGVTPQQKHKLIGTRNTNLAAAQLECGWTQAEHGDWNTGSDAIDSDAAYTPGS